MKTLILLFVLLITASAVFAQTYVRGYVKKNGTYVSGHYRSNPNTTKLDNWSTSGNINPYTGEMGHKNPYSTSSSSYRSGSSSYGNYPTSGSDVQVNSYQRSNGTDVNSYYRTSPDNSIYNNYSTQGNINPYTGERGTK